MTALMDVAASSNVTAQTFVVNQPAGIVMTGVGIWFYSKPTTTQLPVTLEIRPCTESGFPSSRVVYPNTRVTLTPSQVSTSTAFNANSNETKFTFSAPLFLPAQAEVAIVLQSNAFKGEYRFWAAELGEFSWVDGSLSTTVRCTSQQAAGSFFASSNGTSWTAEQTKDFAFKVYRAKFKTNQNSVAVLNPDVPPVKSLSHRSEFNDPLIMTAGDATVSVIHHNHGFNVGDKVKIEGLNAGGSTNGVFNSSIAGSREITARDPFGYTFEMDSAADSSIRAGGLGMLASDQFNIDHLRLNLMALKPLGTEIEAGGKFATQKSYAGTESIYQDTNNVRIIPGHFTSLREPHVLASEIVEDSSFSGNPSAEIRAYLNTTDSNVAPYINLATSSLDLYHNIIDFQDSDNHTLGSIRNTLNTINYVSETNAQNGTALATHITRPVILLETATSIRVLVDAVRQPTAEFDVYYRVSNTSTEGAAALENIAWTAFSKTPDLPNNSNYSDIGSTNDSFSYREYRFNQYDINDFNHYQIKIVMNSRKSTNIVKLKNLRTIATI